MQLPPNLPLRFPQTSRAPVGKIGYQRCKLEGLAFVPARDGADAAATRQVGQIPTIEPDTAAIVGHAFEPKPSVGQTVDVDAAIGHGGFEVPWLPLMHLIAT